MKTKLPTYSDAAFSILIEETTTDHKATALEHFIYEEQPSAVHEKEFRENLEKLVTFYEAKKRKAELMMCAFTAFGGAVGLAIFDIFFKP